MNLGDEEYLEAIKKEKQASKVIEKIVKKHGELLSVLWQWGDGQGACVWNDFNKHMVINGFISEKQINGDVRHHLKEELGLIDEEKILSKNNNLRSLSARTRLTIYEKDGYKCVHCGISKNLSVDHIHPVSLGGNTTINNLQTLCISCNSKKGNRI
jgi:hypothetical protein